MKKYLIAALVTWHLMAIVEGAIPPPSRFAFPERSLPSAAGSFVDFGTVVLDSFTRGLRPVVAAMKWVTSPFHDIATRYRVLTGTGQNWNMFSNPARWDRYMRVRYYIQPAEGRLWTATQLVAPAHREDRIRWVQSFRDSYRDKDLNISLTAFYNLRKSDMVRPETRPEELPKDLAPIARYFRRHFAPRLTSGERIVRTEVWYGTAATPVFGEPVDRLALSERLAVLRDYYEGPVEQRVNVPPIPPYHAGEVEADINWLLEYYEES